MYNKNEEAEYFLEFAKNELRWGNHSLTKRGLEINHFILDGFALQIIRNVFLRVQNFHTLSISDVNRIIFEGLKLSPNDRVYIRKTGISIYPPLYSTMNSQEIAIWQFCVIQELANILRELKK